jgi:CRISPR-associated protein Csd1
MILQSLHALYDRLKDDPAYEIAPPGYSLQKITFRVVLHADGRLFEIQDARLDGRARQLRVLGDTKPSGAGLNPCFLWDNTGYMLGYKPDDDKPERSRAAFEEFRQKHLAVEKAIATPEFSAVCRFLEAWSPEQAAKHPVLAEITTGFGVFQILGETAYVHQHPAVDAWWQNQRSTDDRVSPEGQCLLTGEWGPIARLQPMVKGVAGGKAQAPLVGFNESAYESYGKTQSFNAPVSDQAAFRYGAALNALLDGPMRHKHRIGLGGATVVFWTDRPSLAEDIFAPFAEHGADTLPLASVQDEGVRQKLGVFLRALREGKQRYAELDADGTDTRYYLLALSPNAARLAVRLFLRGTVGELLDNLRRHYRDMGIEPQHGAGAKHPDPEFPPAWLLLRQTARDADGIPPLLAGPLLRAILTGSDYPAALYSAVLRRFAADHTISYLRACIIRGHLARNHNTRFARFEADSG